jgi:hypothetical protein
VHATLPIATPPRARALPEASAHSLAAVPSSEEALTPHSFLAASSAAAVWLLDWSQRGLSGDTSMPARAGTAYGEQSDAAGSVGLRCILARAAPSHEGGLTLPQLCNHPLYDYWIVRLLHGSPCIVCPPPGPTTYIMCAQFPPFTIRCSAHHSLISPLGQKCHSLMPAPYADMPLRTHHICPSPRPSTSAGRAPMKNMVRHCSMGRTTLMSSAPRMPAQMMSWFRVPSAPRMAVGAT